MRIVCRLKSTAIVINAGRGDAIDPEALADLAQWTAHGAGLTSPEPEPFGRLEKSRLWDEPHCLITPRMWPAAII